jgi:cytidylate kinase
LKAFLKENTSYVLDSRMAAFFEPHAFKVFISVSPRIGAERIYADIQINPLRHSESGASSVDDVLAQNSKRAESEQIRYRELYGFDHLNKSMYDFVCDSSSASPEELADRIEEAYKEWIRA